MRARARRRRRRLSAAHLRAPDFERAALITPSHLHRRPPLLRRDVATGAAVTAYKSNASPAGALTRLGRDHFAAAQAGRGSAVHAWAWHGDQPAARSFAPEPLAALAASPCGALVAGGGASGAVHLWAAATGRLLRSWPAHYKRVAALAFSDSGLELVSGGDDTLVAAWLLAEVADAGGDFGSFGGAGGGGNNTSATGPAPLHVWSDHTLPVSAVAFGAGGAGAIVVSVSADRTVRVRALATGAPLRVVTLPAALRCLALDPGEHALWAGGADGVIYEVPLVPVAADGAADDSHGAHAAAAGDANALTYVAMPGHAGGVAALALTADAAALVSGADDGALRVWDLRSRQPVRELPAPAKGPVTGLLVLDRPPAMPAGPGAGGGARRGPRRPAPLAPLAKYAGAPGAGAPWEGPPVLLDGAAGGGGEDSDDGELRGEMAPFDVASYGGGDADAPAAAADAPPAADAEMDEDEGEEEEEEEEEAEDAAPAAAGGGGARWAAVDAGLAEFVAGAGGA